jgi:signal transduction histidine kinase
MKYVYPDRKIVYTNKVLPGKNEFNIIGDKDKLAQVINQILDNACKFSDNEQEIKVLLKFKDPNYIIDVKDKGKGIYSQDLDHVFDKFYSTDQQTDEGLGLGLFLAKEIINHHHGYIKLKSKVDKGTTVEVGLPRLI